MKPEVSVILTTYRRPGLLVEAIESVLAQSYRNFELIVADDGSGDDTEQRVATFGNAVRYLPLGHSGRPEAARNQAIATARGHFLAFLDDDDLWRPEKLARQVAVLGQDEQVGFAYSDGCFLEEDGSSSPPLLSPRQKQSEAVFDTLLEGCFIYPSTVVMRRSLFDQIGPFDESFFCQGDYYLWLRAAQTAPVVCLPQPLVSIRRSQAGLSRQRQLLNVESAIEVLERLRQRQRITARQRWRSRRTLSRWYAHLGLRRQSPAAARRDLLRSVRLNPWQRAAWLGLLDWLFWNSGVDRGVKRET